MCTATIITGPFYVQSMSDKQLNSNIVSTNLLELSHENYFNNSLPIIFMSISNRAYL